MKYIEYECDEDGCHVDLIQHDDLKPPRRGAVIIDEDMFTAKPKGWVSYPLYQHMGLKTENSIIWDAGWCPVCKERCDECCCKILEDIFDLP